MTKNFWSHILIRPKMTKNDQILQCRKSAQYHLIT